MNQRNLGWLALASLFFSLVGCASFQQTDPSLLKSLNYVYDFPGRTSAQIFDTSLAWVATTYNSANSVVQLKDRENGQIIGKGVGTVNYMVYDRDFSYTLRIDTKDNKARISFTNLMPQNHIGANPLSGAIVNVAGLDVTYKEQFDLAKGYFDTVAKSYWNYFNVAPSDKNF